MTTTKPNYEQMKVAELRRYAIDNGYGITYLSSRKKDEIIKILRQEDAKAEERRAAEEKVEVVQEAEEVVYRIVSVTGVGGSVVTANLFEVEDAGQGWRTKRNGQSRRVNFDARQYASMREDYPQGLTGLIVKVHGERFVDERIEVIE